MRKLIAKVVFTALFVSLFILLIPSLGARSASAATKPKLSPKKATITVGETIQLKMTGAKPVAYSIKKNKKASVDSHGLVTALKPSSKGVKVRVKCDNGKAYKCKLYILGQGEALGGEAGGDATNRGTTVEIDSGNTVEYAANVSKLDELGYTSWFNPVKKTKYKSRYVYDGVITNKNDLLKFVSEGFENGAEEIVFDYKGNFYTANDSSCWWAWLNTLVCQYSILGGYGNQMKASFVYNGDVGTATITMVYKEAWNAVTYLKHTGYEASEDAQKIAKKCLQLVDDALAAEGDDKMAVLLHINNAICDMAEYDYSSANAVIKSGEIYSIDPRHDATGVLFEGKGVCEAYTATFRVCLEILGLDNCIINNKDTLPGSGNGHTWNYVQVDGKWYHCDVTWNDTWDNDFFMLNDLELAKMREKEDNKSSHVFYTTYLPQ